MSCTYLAHHELESVLIIIIIIRLATLAKHLVCNIHEDDLAKMARMFVISVIAIH